MDQPDMPGHGDHQGATFTTDISADIASFATHTAVKDGAWNDPATWGPDGVPGDGAIVHIPAGLSVTAGHSDPDTHLFYVHVDGALGFDSGPGDVHMRVDTIITTLGSAFEIDGTSGNLVDINLDAFDVRDLGIPEITDRQLGDNGGMRGRHEWDPGQFTLGVVTEGRVSIRGAEKISNGQITDTLPAGAQSLTLSLESLGLDANSPDIIIALGWQQGDLIVIGASERNDDLDLGNSQSEERVITEITVTPEGVRISFDQPLAHTHRVKRLDTNVDGTIDTVIAPPVVNLSRNVQIRSDSMTETNAAGRVTDMVMQDKWDDSPFFSVAHIGHTMFMHTTDVDVQDALFAGLGRTDKSKPIDDSDPVANIGNQRGRYAVHLHFSGDEPTGDKDPDDPFDYQGAHVSGNAVWGSLGWGYAHHAGLATLTDNVSYQVAGAGFASETGNERGVWDGNVAMTTYANANHTPFSEMTNAQNNHDFGKSGVGFWLESRLLEVTRNTSVESKQAGMQIGGVGSQNIMVEVDTLPEGLMLDRDSIADGLIHPRDIPMRVFDQNTIIGAGDVGIWVDDDLENRPEGMLEHDLQSLISGTVLSEVYRSSIFVTSAGNWTLKDTVVSGVHVHFLPNGLAQKIFIGQYKEAPNFVVDGAFYDKGNDPTADLYPAQTFVDPFNSQGLPEYAPTFINVRNSEGLVFGGPAGENYRHSISQAPGLTEAAQFHAFYGAEDFRERGGASNPDDGFFEFVALPRVIDPSGDMIDRGRFTVILGQKSGEQAFTPTNSQGIYLTDFRLDNRNYVPDGMTGGQVQADVNAAKDFLRDEGFQDPSFNRLISVDPTFIQRIETVDENYIYDTAQIVAGADEAEKAFYVYGVKIDSVGATYTPFIDEKTETNGVDVTYGPGSDLKIDQNPDQMKLWFTVGHIADLITENGVLEIAGVRYTIGELAFADRVSTEVATVSFLIRLNGTFWDQFATNAVFDAVQFGAAKDAEGGVSISMDGSETLEDFGDTRVSQQFVYTEHETFAGDDGRDVIMAHFGNDLVDGGLGDDLLDGGEGEDTLTFASLAAPSSTVGTSEFGVFVNLENQGQAQDTGHGSDLIENFENLDGSDFADLLTGDGAANTLSGLDGADVINGGGGDDLILGGSGFDAVEGGPGADSLFGGTGGNVIEGDIVTYFSATGPLVFDFGATLSEIEVGSSAEVLEDTIGDDIEGLAGASNFSNTFLADELSGVTLFLGGSQADTFEGGTGRDQILGLAGDDVIRGNGDVDGLIGQGGDDDLFGGDGGDVFFFDGVNEGDDTIHDFELAADQILFTGGLFTNLSQFAITTEDADGDLAADDAVLRYSADGFDSSLSILNVTATQILDDVQFILT
ncbi:MAG: hypothetical protein AAGH68_05775 [Pseudomonadota bacterium]